MRILRLDVIDHRLDAIVRINMRRMHRHRFGQRPVIRILCRAHHRERRDAQARRAHRNQRHRIDWLLGVDGTWLQLADHREFVHLPFRNQARLRVQLDRRGRRRERIVR